MTTHNQAQQKALFLQAANHIMNAYGLSKSEVMERCRDRVVRDNSPLGWLLAINAVERDLFHYAQLF